MLKKIRMLDAFAGIGGFHLGVEQACKELGIDFECVGAIEFDKNARETYKANFPTTPLLGLEVGGDITKIDLSNLPEHDILCGGFPCQPFSMAGRAYKNNQIVVDTDNRKDLFQYLISILQLHQPDMFIFENVEGILKLKDNNGQFIIKNIKDAINKCGYNVIIKMVSPHQIGIPQKRNRILFIGKKNNIILKDFDIISKQKLMVLNDILETNVDNYILTNKAIWNQNGKLHNKPRIQLLYESLKQRQIKNPNLFNEKHYDKTILAAEINGDTPSGRSRQTNRAYHYNGLSPTLTTVDKKIIYDSNNLFRYFTEREYARLQGFPDSFQINNKTAYHQFGNAICVEVVKTILKKMIQ